MPPATASPWAELNRQSCSRLVHCIIDAFGAGVPEKVQVPAKAQLPVQMPMSRKLTPRIGPANVSRHLYTAALENAPPPLTHTTAHQYVLKLYRETLAKIYGVVRAQSTRCSFA